MQYRPEPVGEPEAKRQRWWVYLPNHRSGFEWHLVTAPWAEGYCPTGEWPASEVPRTVVGPITKAIYNFKIPVYDWLGNVTYQVHAGVGHSWDAIDVSAKWWIRKEMSDLERPEHDVTVLIPDDV